MGEKSGQQKLWLLPKPGSLSLFLIWITGESPPFTHTHFRTHTRLLREDHPLTHTLNTPCCYPQLMSLTHQPLIIRSHIIIHTSNTIRDIINRHINIRKNAKNVQKLLKFMKKSLKIFLLLVYDQLARSPAQVRQTPSPYRGQQRPYAASSFSSSKHTLDMGLSRQLVLVLIRI